MAAVALHVHAKLCADWCFQVQSGTILVSVKQPGDVSRNKDLVI